MFFRLQYVHIRLLIWVSIKFSRGHIYYFYKIFQGARLFRPARLFHTLEYFFITVRPVITVPDLRIFIPPGEDVSLECIFEFHPRGLMWWERESGEILSRNDKYSIADYILNEFTIRSRLIIRNFQDSDVGRYTCVGRNGFNKEGDREEGHILVNFVKGEYCCAFSCRP